jgi:hypothetical protein
MRFHHEDGAASSDIRDLSGDWLVEIEVSGAA